MKKVVKLQQDRNSPMEWRSLFEVLLANTNTDFELVSQGSHIAIRANEKDIAIISERLERAFGDLNLILPLKFRQRNRPAASPSSVVDSKELEITRPEATVEAGKQIFDRIFGKLARQFGFMPDIVFGPGTTVDELKLWSQEAPQGVADFWVHGIDLLISACDKVTANEFRQTWKGNDSPLAMPTQSPTDFALARGLMQQCIGHRTDIDNDKKRHTHFFFDFGTFWEFLSKPTVNIACLPQPTADGYTHEICLNEVHLVHYLQMLMQDGVMFRVYRNEAEAKEFNTTPIFLTNPDLCDLQNLHVLVLDKSSSMRDDFGRLIEQVQIYINQIRHQDPNARVRIVPFAQKIEPIGDYSISNKSAIDTFMLTLKADGSGTALFSSVDDELTHLTQLNVNHNIKMVVFTDGQNNEGREWSLCEGPIAEKINLLNQIGTLQIIPIGAGAPENSILTKMAETCGTEYTYFKSASDLDGRFQEAATSQPIRRFVNLFVQLQNQTRQFSLRIPQTGGPFIPAATEMSFAMCPGQQMVVQQQEGEQFEFTLLNPDEIPNATLVDRLRRHENKALSIAGDQTRPEKDRIRMLNEIISLISSERGTKQYEQLFIANCKIRVQSHINVLERGQSNPNMAAAAITRFRQQSGLAQVQTVAALPPSNTDADSSLGQTQQKFH